MTTDQILKAIELECKNILTGFAHEPNNSQTWDSVKRVLSNSLDNHWKDGNLKGDKSNDAYQVLLGLGSTMTAEDIANGYMRVTVVVAPVKPAEFIVLMFEQQVAAG